MRSTTWWLGMAFLGTMCGCGTSSALDGAGGSGGASACTVFADVPAATDVVIRIVNQRAVPVYVDTECRYAFDVQAGDVTHPGAMGWPIQTCFTSRTTAPPCCDCGSPGTPIEPGATWETHWSGLYYDTTKMPDACYEPSTQPTLHDCAQPTAAANGPLTLLPHVFATSIHGLLGSVSDPIPLTKDFVLGTDGVVEVVVE